MFSSCCFPFTSTLTLTCLWVIEICNWNFQILPECDQCVLYLKNRDFFYFLQAHLTRYFHHQKSYLIFCTWLIISLNSNQRERYNFFCRKYFSGMKIYFLIITITIYLISCFRALLQRRRFDSTKNIISALRKKDNFISGSS